VEHSEGKDEERDVAIPRFQGGSPHLSRLSGSMGPDKTSRLVTTLLNCPPALRLFVGGRMRQPRMMAGPGIAGSQDFISGAKI
jgi:hypothetical protein